MLEDISGMTVGEAKGVYASIELRLDRKAVDEGRKRTPGRPWLRVFQTETKTRCPWGNEQYVANEKGVLGPRETNWDSSGQALIEYVTLVAFISLMCLCGVIAVGQM
jgi:hypothetical protein